MFRIDRGTVVLSWGSRGVYQVLFPSKKSGKLACYIVPMGSAYAGTIEIMHPDVKWSPLATPMGKLYFGTNKLDDFTFMGTYDGSDSLSFTFCPPGTSNLPVEIVIVPQHWAYTIVSLKNKFVTNVRSTLRIKGCHLDCRDLYTCRCAVYWPR